LVQGIGTDAASEAPTSSEPQKLSGPMAAPIDSATDQLVFPTSPVMAAAIGGSTT